MISDTEHELPISTFGIVLKMKNDMEILASHQQHSRRFFSSKLTFKQSGLTMIILKMFRKTELPIQFTYDFWATNVDSLVELNCLMPNGMFIIFPTVKTCTFNDIKEDLWEESLKYPLHGVLHDSSSYSFLFINTNSEVEELYDENKRLCDIKPFGASLKIVERQNDKAEKAFEIHMGHLIGKGLHEFDMLKSKEINIFRSAMKHFSEDLSSERKLFDWQHKMCYQFPPDITLIPADQQILSNHSPMPGKLREGHFVVSIRVEEETCFKFNISIMSKASHLLAMIITKRATTFLKKKESSSNFSLKVCGKDEYIYGKSKLINFFYIYHCLIANKVPNLVLVPASCIPLYLDENLYYRVSNDVDCSNCKNVFHLITLRKRKKYINAYNIVRPFSLRICFLSNLNTQSEEAVVQVSLFHGGKPLCQPKYTELMAVKEGCCTIEQNVSLDIAVADIPRMAKLCFVIHEICSVTKNNARGKKYIDSLNREFYINPLGWVNTTVYEHTKLLKTGCATYYLWTTPDENADDFFHPLGTIVSNPDTKNATALSISYHTFHHNSKVMYPSVRAIAKFISEYEKTDLYRMELKSTKVLLETIRDVNKHMTRYEMHEQDRKSLWALRYKLAQSDPDLLAKLLDCVDWNNRFEVYEMIYLLQTWPLLDPQRACELLDYVFADKSIRKFAVTCLHSLTDDQLMLYLLQLVQAVKHECFLNCELVQFLLMRSLSSQKIGHFLFWHLRSEMKVTPISVRFGLILEAYCRGCPEHIKILYRQIEFLDKLKTTNELVNAARRDKDKSRAFLQEHLQEQHCSNAFYYVTSPIDGAFKIRKVIFEKCRVMDSKARPLWLVFANGDNHGENIQMIFKNGDDLRQDMLTLQMLRIMDGLWKSHGLDLRIDSYGCISTDTKVGLIQVVSNAETIANIQKEKGIFSATSAFRKGSVLAWLKEHNPSDEELDKAITEFTYSCAGYCVATFVLGVADRHSDNIMLKKTGQLFHIDFGHILGHFKEKFGFKRERVPFVLTHDFVHVINKGQTKGEIEEFYIFRKLCQSAFLILRQHGSLILSLFGMMISTGLPELSSENDLSYLHESLVLHLSDEEAEEYFQNKFTEALSNSWKTSLNWASHNVSKNNRI